VEIARLAPGEDLFRRRLEGYAEAHLGNPRRVHGKLPAAEESFGRARALGSRWRATRGFWHGTRGEPLFLSRHRWC
jgi:hypothetical protein